MTDLTGLYDFSPRLLAQNHHLAEQLHRLIQGHVPRRLQQPPQRANVQRHQCLSSGGLSGGAHRCGNDLLGSPARGAQLLPVGAKGVGVDDPGPGGHR